MNNRREATYAVGGYYYQMSCSVLAWLNLAEGERLYIEDYEDYAIRSANLHRLVQIKKTSGPLSLRTASVISAIQSCWTYSLTVFPTTEFFYQSTAEPCVEKGSPFGPGVTGISTWMKIASSSDHSSLSKEIAETRAFLLSALEGDDQADLVTFVANASDGAFVDRIIRPVRFVTSAPDQEAIDAAVIDRLVEYGATINVTATDAGAAYSKLVQLAWECAKSSEKRVLRRSDFMYEFEQATGAWVPKAFLGKRAAVGNASSIDLLTPVVLTIVALCVFIHEFWSLLSAALICPFYLSYSRTRHILEDGGSKESEGDRSEYRRFRDSLQRSPYITQIFRGIVTKVLEETALFFGGPHLKPEGSQFVKLWPPAPLWTHRAFDRCLWLAIIYPLTSIVVAWALSGKVSQAQAVLKLPADLQRWQLALQVGALLFEAYAIWKIMSTRGWTSAVWAIGGGIAAITGVVGLANVRGPAIVFASAAVGAVATGVVAILFLKRVGALRGSVQGVAAMFGILISTFGYATIGILHPIAGGVAGGAIAILVTGIASYTIRRLNLLLGAARTLALTWLILVGLSFSFARLISADPTWGKAGPMLLFMGLLPLLNTPFDWISIGTTRYLLQRGIDRGGWWPLVYAVADAAIAVPLIALLAITLVVGNQTFNECSLRPVVELRPLLDGISANPLSAEYWWAYLLLLSTLIPSMVNLMIGGASLCCGAPGLPKIMLRFMPVDGPPSKSNVAWISLVYASQIVGGMAIGIAFQFFLALLIIGYAMPFVGADLLQMCEDIFELNIPKLAGC
ncbi:MULTISPECIES: hypothetical protein [unclassified Sinorhizobium]|uniref:hypothetical protein n=1 Tax=unclassified Sinorhizobium TaxID=2613772 RepID=UPI003523648B